MSSLKHNPVLAEFGVTLDDVKKDENLLDRVRFRARVVADMPLIGTLAEISRYQLENSTYSLTRTWYAKGEKTHVVRPGLPREHAYAERDRLQRLADEDDPSKPFGRLLYGLQRDKYNETNVMKEDHAATT